MLVATVISAIPDINLGTNTAQIELSSHLDDTDVTGNVVRVSSVVGDILIETFDSVTPNTANNFLELVRQGRFEDMFFHRSVPGFVVQGGGFTWPTASDQTEQVSHFGTLDNEFANWFNPQFGNLSQGTPINTRGTLAMAKVGGDPNSATSQFFFNLGDNSSNLDGQNGGFTVFARTIKDTISVVDTIAGLQRVNAGGPFDTLPVRNYESGFVERPHLILASADVVDELTFSVTANSNSDLVQTSIQNGQLTLTPLGQQAGTAEITVQAVDLAGQIVTDTFVVTVGVPDATAVTGPVAPTTARPTITWDAVASADSYQLWVNQIGGQNSIISEQQLSTNQFQPTSDLADGSYRAWVRSQNAFGFSQWSEAFVFTIGTSPGTPTLSGPNGSITGAKPTFKWSAVGGADTYDLWVNAVGIRNQIIRETALTGTSFTAASDLPDGTYKAWLRASNSSGTSRWSAAATFEITAGVVSTITGPTGTSIGVRPEFTWTGDASATYELWVNAIGGTARVIHDTGVTGTSFTPTSDLADGDYRAWVRRRPASESAGAWSYAFEFTVGQRTIPGRGVIANVTGLDTARPTFDITAAENAVRYELWVNLVGGTVRILHATDITALQYQASTDLAAGTYRAWLRGFSNDDIAGAWSSMYEFTLT